MRIDKGDLFVITKGKCNQSHYMTRSGLDMGLQVTEQHDTSYENCVFLALEVCDTMVAAKAVFTGLSKDYVKKSNVSMNTQDVEIMTVTPEYLDALLNKEQAVKETK